MKIGNWRWSCRLYLAGFYFVSVTCCYTFAQNQADPVKRETMFRSLDANADGFLETSELPARMKASLDRLDANTDGKVSLDEMRATAPRRSGRAAPKRPGEIVGPADHDERTPDALATGDVAPDFTLPYVGQAGSVTLSDLYREKPVVLIFGSISCPPFRAQIQQVDSSFKAFGEKVSFLMVYIREAHPDSKIMVKQHDGVESLQEFIQTDDAELRTQHAKTCATTLELSFPTAMDQVDNKVSHAYAGWPIRIVTIGTDGKVIDPGEKGPQGFHPAKLAEWLKEL